MTGLLIQMFGGLILCLAEKEVLAVDSNGTCTLMLAHMQRGVYELASGTWNPIHMTVRQGLMAGWVFAGLCLLRH